MKEQGNFLNSGAGTRVELGDRGYDIVINSGNLGQFGRVLKNVWQGKRLFVVTNEIVGNLYAETVVSSASSAGFETSLITIPDGESRKNLETVNYIYTELLKAGADRGSALAALGGGVTGDIGGFAAATYMRGIPYIQIPTTLLAQVDSSVGGKTGVNHEMGKNLIGAFCQPQLVFIDIATLSTVLKEDFQSGLYEVIKYGLIWDESFFEFLVSNMDRIKNLERDVLLTIIQRCCEIKAEVVAVDEKESGLRRILNFGHTLGHALEAAASYGVIPHGQAVGYGMIAAAYLSRFTGLIEDVTLDRVVKGILSAGELPSVKSIPADTVVRACSQDKKKEGNKLLFVLLDRVGHTVTRPMDTDDPLLGEAWESCLKAVKGHTY